MVLFLLFSGFNFRFHFFNRCCDDNVPSTKDSRARTCRMPRFEEVLDSKIFKHLLL